MEETPTASWLLNESHSSQECLNGNRHSLHDSPLWFEEPIQAAMGPMCLASPNLGQSYNQLPISTDSSLITNVRGTPLASPNLGQIYNQPSINSNVSPIPLAHFNLGQSYNQPEISSEVVPSPISNVSTPLAAPKLAQSYNQPEISSEVVPKRTRNVRRPPLAAFNLGQSYNKPRISSEVVPKHTSNVRRIPLAVLNLSQSYNQPGTSSEVVPSLNSDVSTPLASQNLVQSHNQSGRSSGAEPRQNRNVSRRLAFQPSNNSNGSFLERINSSLSESDPETDPAKIKKREIDRAYRQRCKKQKIQTESHVENLKGENDSLKKQIESLNHDNSLMNQALTDHAEEMDQLRNDLTQVKREKEHQNVLVQTLSGLLADAGPMRLENEKLKAENASLRINATLDSSNLPQLAEENAKLRIENKALKVQNDALCGKIIHDDDKK